MDAFDRTTKQIAAKYKDNLTYWYKPNYLRSWKLGLFLLAVGLSAFLGIAAYFAPPNENLYSTGPVSRAHQNLECRDCHSSLEDTKTNPHAANASLLSKVSLGHLKEGFHSTLSGGTSFEKLDKKCNECHIEGRTMHQPRAELLQLAQFRRQVTGAKVDACSECHREHQGAGKMPIPASTNCVECHTNRDRLIDTLFALPNPNGKEVPPSGIVTGTADDATRRFIPPRAPYTPEYEPAIIHSLLEGHPDFGYQATKEHPVRDPGQIRFNHQEHLNPRRDGKALTRDGKELTCTTCHKPVGAGLYMGEIQYERDCRACHTLLLTPTIPELTVPHKAPEKVKEMVSDAGMTVLINEVALAKGYRDPQERFKYVSGEFTKINQLLGGQAGVLNAVFKTGYPADRPRDQQLTACIKCHISTNYPKEPASKWINKTNLAERWLTRGPFNHARHQHVDCQLCHAQAKDSRETSDILLPARALCASCHRERAEDVADVSVFQLPKGLSPKDQDPKNIEMTQFQLQGGVASACQYCHKGFHAEQDATNFVRKLTGGGGVQMTSAAPAPRPAAAAKPAVPIAPTRVKVP